MLFVFLGHVASADILLASTVISNVGKREPLTSQERHSSLRPSDSLTLPSHLSDTAKRKPSLAKKACGDFENLSPIGMRGKLSSRSAIVMDSDTNQVLYAHEPDLTGQPASTIKILTGLIAMKSLGDSTKVGVSQKASRMPRSKIYLHQGREYKANDLINAVLIASANDASVALAEKVAGSEQTFVKLMNHKARELGARSTLCKTASGLTVRGQHSTVRDLAMIFNGAMQDEEFAERISKIRTRTSYGRLLSNHNRALWRIDGARGGKTGYTHSARQTYVGKFERDGQAITVAIMGSETMWADISNLVEYGFVRKNDLTTTVDIAQNSATIPAEAHLSEDQGSSAVPEDVAIMEPLLLSEISKHRQM